MPSAGRGGPRAASRPAPGRATQTPHHAGCPSTSPGKLPRQELYVNRQLSNFYFSYAFPYLFHSCCLFFVIISLPIASCLAGSIEWKAVNMNQSMLDISKIILKYYRIKGALPVEKVISIPQWFRNVSRGGCGITERICEIRLPQGRRCPSVQPRRSPVTTGLPGNEHKKV